MQTTGPAIADDGQDVATGATRSALRLEGLMGRVARFRDRGAFASLFSHFAPRLKSFYLGRGVDDAMAEDLVQETMLVAWQRASEYSAERAAVSTWLFTIARNLSVDRLRRERRYDPQTPPEDALTASALTPDAVAVQEPDEALAQRQQERVLRRALDTLPDEQRRVIELYYRQWLTTGEIARNEALSQGTVKSRMRLALRRLRDELEAS